MRKKAAFWLFPILLVVAFLLAPLAVIYGNEVWNCTSWHDTTGDKTKIIAGSCYVYNTKHKQYEIFSTYIRRGHIGISDETEQDNE